MVAELTDKKVLVIDDELGPRESLRMLLKNDCDVTCACSVDEGIDILHGMSPDIVIMDIRMPGKSGIDGLGEIRKIDPLVSIVMLTGFGSLETAQQALRLGANDYLSKPFDTGKMQKTVDSYIERTRLERKRADMLDQLRSMNSRLINDLADKDRMATIGQTSAEFIHDLRNPLTIVNGYVELLAGEIEKTKEMNGQAAEYLEVIEQNIQRCCEMSRTWQRYGKSQDATFKPIPIVDILHELVPGIELLASTKGVAIKFDCTCSDAVINGSSSQLIRAVHNIVTNAIQAVGEQGGVVHMACQTAGDSIEIRIDDNGCGMSPEVKARLFDSYFTTKSSDEGTGLGMGITRKIVEEHHGQVYVESTEAEGTTVVISIPLVLPSEAAGQ